MRRESDITDRAQLIDDPGNVDPPAEIRDHRQRSKAFLQHNTLDQLGTRTHSTTTWSTCHTHTQTNTSIMIRVTGIHSKACAKSRT
ncbi:hypothetical protein, partial [Actinoplanes solisilvae]|uniref:hypothetical protein n=1 Tax=Actinoplanes solisilvae TaxID=2486853 RepID=UPI001F0CB5B3